jgi:single-stranded-DNA-specific exonuclease
VAQLLYNRGLGDPCQAELFLTADRRLSADPFLLPDMHQAVSRIYRALLSGEKMAVYGDFDADGITATAVLVKGLTVLDGQVTPYIPHRLTEGYGLKEAALEKLHKGGISLVISADCGITALPEVKKANRMGLDIVITDHHTAPDELPVAVASVNPKRADSAYPTAELAGVGVAYKLLQALYSGSGKESRLEDLLDLVAIGTVADIMPLTGENRYLVKEGLKRINDAPRLGISHLLDQTRLDRGRLDTKSISWVLAPRLNAAGRLEHAMTSYRLLTTDSAVEAQELASWLETKNAERQKLTARFLEKAREQVATAGIGPLLITSNTECPVGILGLVAGRLAEEFYRPTVAIKVGQHVSTGSCRSIPEFNITAAISKCSELLTHFGGHAQAAGFTLPTENLPRLKECLTETAAEQLAGIDLRPHLDIDMEVKLGQLNGATLDTIQRLAPFGAGNPEPVFLSRNVSIAECRSMGSSGQHLKLKLKQSESCWDGVCFRMGEAMAEVRQSPLDLVYNLELDRWRGVDTLRLNILDFAPSEKIV